MKTWIAMILFIVCLLFLILRLAKAQIDIIKDANEGGYQKDELESTRNKRIKALVSFVIIVLIAYCFFSSELGKATMDFLKEITNAIKTVRNY